MNISINGKPHEIAEGTTVSHLLQRLEIKGPLAVEINRQVCPKKTHQETQLKEGDVLEIVTIVGGG